MGKRRFAKSNNVKIENESNIVRIIEEEGNQIWFEIGNEVTADVAEAVALMMKIGKVDQAVWNREVYFDLETIEPRRALYWLSGGNKEWNSLQNYNTPWTDCHLDFQEEFGIIIISILKRSKTLGDIRDKFLKYLNLPVLYEFALSKDYIRY